MLGPSGFSRLRGGRGTSVSGFSGSWHPCTVVFSHLLKLTQVVNDQTGPGTRHSDLKPLAELHLFLINSYEFVVSLCPKMYCEGVDKITRLSPEKKNKVFT